MSIINKNKQYEKEAINKIASIEKISFEEAYSMYHKLSQKKKRKLISTHVEKKG